MKVGTIGFAGSGKTTLIGALTLSLIQGDATSDLALFSFEGAQATRELTQHADTLQRGRWPARTDWSKVTQYELRLRRKSSRTVFTLTLPELPGELLDEVWRTDHLPAALAFLLEYDAYLLLVDATLDDLDHRVAQHVHLLQGLKRAKGHRPDELAPEPLGLVWTKWDALPEDEQALDPESFGMQAMPLLTDWVHSNCARRRLFSASAVGAVDAAGNPLLQRGRVVPRGVFAPIEWISEELGGQRAPVA